MSKTKLELTWIGKDQHPRLEPRILLEDLGKSYHASQKVTESDIFDNKLIFGDNLLALKALEQEYSGKVKCVFIDPPYNTGSAFAHYDDGVEHSLWLGLMRDRLEIIKRLLSDEGSLWIAIDDNECHYLKVLCDEIFGRDAFISSMVWENFYGRSNAAAISPGHNYILLYSPMGSDWKSVRNLLPRDEKSAGKYKNTDNDPRGSWRLGPIFAGGERHEGLMYEVTIPSGRKVRPPKGSHWRMLEPDFWRMVDEGRIVFGESGDNNPAIKLFLNDVQGGMVPRTWWPHTEVGHTQEAKREVQELFPGDLPFDTPKPERLIERIIQVATNPGDIVLDSFAGSGTTGAVAHKMRRKWIMIELEEHCETVILPRLKKVIGGEDQGGISKATNWLGGGGFRYYTLAPSLLQKDQWDNWVINKEYNAEMLAEAVCKLEGFTYAPSDTVWWNHGYSTETDFVYVTTQNLSLEKLERLSEEVGSDKTLLVMCGAFRCKAERFANLTLKKLPKVIVDRCQWAHDDYSLNVQNLPMAEAPAAAPFQDDLFEE
ncbi:site-specific DNA-methyltransferase [Pseudomonas frederiksbergensis]|jgi:adenine-specific DNA-methyltransferase|uniref:site-specific DNA-methyltransferase n=1 Tax=Pseudomonas frederiksbergensis TaxID=104087 RepID=UPI003D22DCDC